MKRHALLPAVALLSTLSSLALHGDPALGQGRAPTCEDLVWSAQVLAANPDIRKACQGVYVRNDQFYAKVSIELLRVRGNRLTFQTRWNDGGTGTPRSITVPASWRARIDGRSYAASELQAGQELNVYVPEDRFALGVPDSDSGALDLFPIEADDERMDPTRRE